MKQGTIRLPKKRQFQQELREHESAPIVEVAEELPPQEPQYPSDWHKGQLLNVRNTGADYTITLYPEEYDPRSPERALHFTNPADAQNFISQWYMREQGGRPW